MADPFDPNNPNRTPYTGQFGMTPQPPVNYAQQPPRPAPPVQTSNSQLAGQNYNMGSATPRPVPVSGAGYGAGAGNIPASPFPNQVGSNNMGYGASNVLGASPTSQYTSGGNEIIPGGHAGAPLILNQDTGRPFITGDGKVMAFVGSGGLSQFGNPNLGLLGGDPMNYGSGLGGQYSYANVQNAKLQGMAQDALNKQGPQANLGATNMFATGTGNALQHADSTNLLGINSAQTANATDLYGMRQGLDMAGLAQGQAAQGQLNAAGSLMNMSQMPAGPSVAEQQLKMGQEANMHQQLAMAAGARGGNAGLALQNAGANAGAANAQLGGQQALLRAQEDMANRQFSANAAQASGQMFGNLGQTQANAYGGAANIFGNVANNQLGQANVYGNIAQNQLGQANVNAGLTNTYAGLAGQQLGADVASQGQNNQLGLGLMGMGYGLQAQDRNAALQQQQNQMDLNARLYATNRGVDEQEAARQQQAFKDYMGAGISAVGTMGAVASDLRAKKNIKPAGEQVSDAFRAANSSADSIRNTTVPYPMATGSMPAYSYEYKNPAAVGAKPGIAYGPMAQDLEQTPAGASVVQTMPNGMKGIDTPRLTMMTASEVAKQRAELDALKREKELTVDRRAPMITQLPKLNAAQFGQYGAPSEIPDYAPQHAQILGYNMDGTPVMAGPQGRIGFQPGQMGYGV